MIMPSLREQPYGAAILHVIGNFMDIILHIGAHRTGTTTFQDYLRRNCPTFLEHKVGILTPHHTRTSLFSGLFPGPQVSMRRDLQKRAGGRIRMQMELLRAQGFTAMLVSDENMIGSTRGNLRSASLYPAIGHRMARFAAAFGGKVSRILITPRSQDKYWASAFAFGVSRGHRVPDAAIREQVVHSRRGWRDVITDLSCAVPEADIRVLPFETFVGRPDAVLREGAGLFAPTNHAHDCLNASPDLPKLRQILVDRGVAPDVLPAGMGRWQPFDDTENSIMRENYADDIMWLTAGADGLATLTKDPTGPRAEQTLPPGGQRQGQQNDQQKRHLARPRQS